MSRIHEALKKAEQERGGHPRSPEEVLAPVEFPEAGALHRPAETRAIVSAAVESSDGLTFDMIRERCHEIGRAHV